MYTWYSAIYLVLAKHPLPVVPLPNLQDRIQQVSDYKSELTVEFLSYLVGCRLLSTVFYKNTSLHILYTADDLG